MAALSTPMVSLHQLRTFATVVEQGSLSRAAQLLGLTQPAISAQMRQLESFVGASVLSRDGRRMVTTEAGAALYRYACEVLSATDMLLQQAGHIRSGELDHLTVGANPSYSAYVLPELLARFHRQHRKMRLSLVSVQSPELIQLVQRDAVDLAIVVAERLPADLRPEVLGEDEFVIIESTTAPISPNGRLTLEELCQQPFVRPSIGRERFVPTLYRLLAERGLPPPSVVMDLPTWEAMKEAVRAGVGLGLILRAAVQREVARGELQVVTVDGYQDRREVCLLQPPRLNGPPPSLAFQELLQWLREELPRLMQLRAGEQVRTMV